MFRTKVTKGPPGLFGQTANSIRKTEIPFNAGDKIQTYNTAFLCFFNVNYIVVPGTDN